MIGRGASSREGLMPVSSDYLSFVLEQLAGLGGVSARRMFGGVGLYCEELFFGLLDDDTLYLRVNDANRADYTARGMAPFRPYPDRPEVSMTYYETPAEILEDPAQLVAWARRSVAAALAAAKRPPRARPPGKGPRGRPKGEVRRAPKA
jgi:DNA transformation protein and related proteins